MFRIFRQFYESITRFFYWGWKMRNSYDWDYHYLYDIMYLKMKRMLHSFENYGCGLRWEEKNDGAYKSLVLAIKLIERLKEDQVYYRYYDRIDKKYGKLEMNHEPIEGSTNLKIHFTRGGLKEENMTNYDEYIEEQNKYMEISNNIRERDKRILFQILNEYMESWWD